MSFRTIQPFSKTAVGDTIVDLKKEMFLILDGGYGEVVFTLKNTGADDAFLVVDQDTTSSADEILNDSIPRVFGPYDMPHGLPFLFIKNGGDVLVSPKVRGLYK